jgi:hypothetical protein
VFIDVFMDAFGGGSRPQRYVQSFLRVGRARADVACFVGLDLPGSLREPSFYVWLALARGPCSCVPRYVVLFSCKRGSLNVVYTWEGAQASLAARTATGLLVQVRTLARAGEEGKRETAWVCSRMQGRERRDAAARCENEASFQSLYACSSPLFRWVYRSRGSPFIAFGSVWSWL